MRSLRSNCRKVKFFISRHKGCMLLCGIFITSMLWIIFSGKTAQIREEVSILTALPCLDSDSKMVIETICSLYKSGEIVGDICEPLCDKQLIQFVRCLNYKHGKHVLQVECKDTCKPEETVTAVLKMTHNLSDLHSQLEKIDAELLMNMQLQEEIGKMGIHNYVLAKRSLAILVQDGLSKEYGIALREGQDFFSLLWNGNYARYFQGEYTNLLFARSFWSVVRQNEYRISKAFEDWNVFPKIYGSCGALYLAENAPALTSFNKFFSFFGSERPPWITRAKTAMSILQLVHRMQMLDHPLHLCDVKSPHFGITADNSVKFVDADTVFAEETLNQDLGSQSCAQHEDCAFFDCEGWCEASIGKCSPLRTNNNLQMVCAKIFRGSFLSTYGGLLTSPPESIATELTNLINNCAEGNPEGEHRELNLKQPDNEVLTKIYDLLAKSLNADSN